VKFQSFRSVSLDRLQVSVVVELDSTRWSSTVSSIRDSTWLVAAAPVVKQVVVEESFD